VVGYRETRDNSGSRGGLVRNQGQKRAPVVGYCETRDKGEVQLWVTAKSGTMASSCGGLLLNQGQRRPPVVGYRETRDNGGSSSGLLRNQG
jgi:hypothetical protein